MVLLFGVAGYENEEIILRCAT